ncbi:TPA: glycosyltransferase family 4 protein, partial [Morganella morganii]|nr:glycosyltransferase family 4 protein [Morganella morganii]
NVITIHNPIGFSSEKISNVKNKRIIAVGRLEYQKGFDLLINILNTPKFKESGWALDIFGTGSQKNKLQEIITSNNIGNIFLKGNSQDIKAEMLGSDFLVLSSRFEGFPMVLAEAMECGLPCISFDCPNGPSDIIKNGENGFLIDMNNNSLFFEKIILLIESYDLRKELSVNAKKSIKSLTLESITKSWINLLSGLKNEK